MGGNIAYNKGAYDRSKTTIVSEGISMAQAEEVLQAHKIEKLPCSQWRVW